MKRCMYIDVHVWRSNVLHGGGGQWCMGGSG